MVGCINLSYAEFLDRNLDRNQKDEYHSKWMFASFEADSDKNNIPQLNSIIPDY